ncbi:Hypothetical protein I5071_27480 [Sandaracinus amylolyticus]|nr:Hypothetical protein I5071_27480 [Sandaracinus amylolyticus]
MLDLEACLTATGPARCFVEQTRLRLVDETHELVALSSAGAGDVVAVIDEPLRPGWSTRCEQPCEIVRVGVAARALVARAQWTAPVGRVVALREDATDGSVVLATSRGCDGDGCTDWSITRVAF